MNAEPLMKASRVIGFCLCLTLLGACVTESKSGSAVPSETDAAVANTNLGAGYLRQGKPDLAIERLRRALEQNPKNAEAHSMIALAYDQLGSTEEAEDHYKRAVQLQPENGLSANAYGVFLCRHKRWKDSEPYFKRAADSHSYRTPEIALTNAGNCAADNGDPAKAAEYYRAALARNAKFADALRGMMDLSYQLKNYLQARAFVQRYLDSQPPNAAVLWVCVNVERELANRAAVDKCATQLRSTFPTSPEVAQLQALQQSNGGQ
jgi:type IV pilus assembly protein PilF